MQLRQYQEEAVQSIWTYFQQASGNPLLAMPTGTGKSVVIAAFLQSIFSQFPNQRVIIATHVKELIAQNHDKLHKFWPQAPSGIYSAGLKQKDLYARILFGGIASLIRVAEQLPKVDLVIVDEAHLVSPNEETTYQLFFKILSVKNPRLKVIGLTATPWRLGQGKLIDNGIFTDVCFDITGVGAFNRLIREKFLAPLIPRQTSLLIDTSKVHKSGGEFKQNELQEVVDKEGITYSALQETLHHAADRNHFLIFATGVHHAESIASMFSSMGIECRPVHSKMPEKERDQTIKAFLSGELRAVVNNNVLTTGFDFPALDCIVVLRPTASPVLWVQMLGRGTRPSPDTNKENCLVLDFAGNTARLGPINDPVIPKAKGKGVGEAPVKICPKCQMYNHASARYCGGIPAPSSEGCGHEFVFGTKLRSEASTHDIIKSDLPIVTKFDVESVTYTVHAKVGRPPCMRVSYYTKLHKFTEFVHFELPGWGERKASDWWKKRTDLPRPASTTEAVQQSSKLPVPLRVNVWVNKQYPEVMSVEFEKESSDVPVN